MTESEDLVQHNRARHTGDASRLNIADYEFRSELLEKLGQIEAKIDMLVGNGQPGRVTLAEQRITVLEKSDIRRGVYDRLINAGIAIFCSAAIALHDHLGLR